MSEISLEMIINLVVREVVRELAKSGVKVVSSGGCIDASDLKKELFNKVSGTRTRVETIDMSRYKSPVLIENHIRRLHELTGEIVIPKGTVITPKARQLLKQKQISVVFENSGGLDG